jgi:adenylylsulfate kinase
MDRQEFCVKEVGQCYWLTGLSGAGKTTLANGFSAAIRQRGIGCVVLDGDTVRKGLNRDLAFGRDDRRENIRRLAEIAKLVVEQGLYVVVSAISPYEEDRRFARSLFGEGCFFEVYVAADRATCIARDPKGLYKRAQAGQIRNLTGVGDPYEAPQAPDILIDTSAQSVHESVSVLVGSLLSSRRNSRISRGE